MSQKLDVSTRPRMVRASTWMSENCEMVKSLYFVDRVLLKTFHWHVFFHRLRSVSNPPLASADMLLINPPCSLKTSSTAGGSDTPTAQKKHNNVDNLRLQGTIA